MVNMAANNIVDSVIALVSLIFGPVDVSERGGRGEVRKRGRVAFPSLLQERERERELGSSNGGEVVSSGPSCHLDLRHLDPP